LGAAQKIHKNTACKKNGANTLTDTGFAKREGQTMASMENEPIMGMAWVGNSGLSCKLLSILIQKRGQKLGI